MNYKTLFPGFFTAEETLHITGGGRDLALGRTVNMLVWNIYKGRIGGWHEDLLQLIEDKHLVLLQEAVLNTQYDPTFSHPEFFEWVMARSHKIQKTLVETGVKTGSIVKSLSQSFFLSPDLEPFFKTPKILLATTYPIGGTEKTLMVANIHAINFVSFHKYARHIAQIVEAVESHDGPVILAGDLNSWSKARDKALLEITERMGMTQVILDRKGRWQHFNKHLDHVFYKGLILESAGVVPQISTSDHFPIVAKFTIPENL